MRIVYTLIIFFSAFLLFLVQPMMAKAILPLVGGAPAVWIVTMLFFQLLLLGGYAYAALTSAYMQPKSQWLLQIALLGITLIVMLPLGLRTAENNNIDHPEIWALMTLLCTVGLPYFALSAHSSLLQRWYHHHFQEEPYPLFSASNLGSLLGLLSYPLLVERLLPLPQQMAYWGWGLLLLAALITLPGLRLQKTESVLHGLGKAMPWKRSLYIIFLAFVPSSLFLGVTLYVTTDIASLPLIWIFPLTLYLLSFILVFSRWGETWTKWAQKLHLVTAVAALFFISFGAHTWAILAHFFFFFILAISCHGHLARLKPSADSLTSYYLWLSVGGALGGLFNTVAPHLFTEVWEYPLVLILSVLALPSKIKLDGKPSFSHAKMVGMGLAAVAAIGFIWFSDSLTQSAGVQPKEEKEILHQSRNFFGVSKVSRDSKITTYMHGTTTHGIQARDEEFRLKPGSYYFPIYKLMQKLPDSFFIRPFATVGLGAGTTACYGRKGQRMDFFEIDQAVIDIAQNPDYFTYLRDCPPQSKIYKGDGRLELAKQPKHEYQLLLLDAFTSDAVPMHLLTKEALTMYMERLVPGEGMLAFDISNRHLELEDFIARVGMELGWQSYVRMFLADVENPYVFSSKWLIMLPPESPWKKTVLKARFKLLAPAADTPLWTDDYSNILPAIKMRGKKENE